MKTILLLLFVVFVTIDLKAQKRISSNDNNIHIDIYNSLYDEYRFDVKIAGKGKQKKYIIKSAFSASYENINIIECDLDNDNINEYILLGLSGGNGITVNGYLIDLKFSLKPVCNIYLSVNPDSYKIITGNIDKMKILITERSNSGFDGQIFYSCYKYSNGRLYFDYNKEDTEYIGICSKQIDLLKADLDIQRNDYWKTEDNRSKYYNRLYAFIMQNRIINEKYEPEKEVEYYDYHYKSNHKVLIDEINKSFNEYLNQSHRYQHQKII